MKVELGLNLSGGFNCYHEETFFSKLEVGSNFTLICEKTGKEILGKIGFSLIEGYFFISYGSQERRALSSGMSGIFHTH